MLRMKLAYDTHEVLMLKLTFFQGLDVAIITEMVYRLKPMQIKRKVRNTVRNTVRNQKENACKRR